MRRRSHDSEESEQPTERHSEARILEEDSSTSLPLDFDNALPSWPPEFRAMTRELERLRRLFEDRLKYDEARETHFSRVYAELDQYKRDEVTGRMLNLARSIILVIDKLRSSEVISDFLRAELGECLAREGIEPIAATENGVGVEEVVGFLDDSTVGDRQVVAEGYKFEGKVLRPRRILIRRGRLGDKG